MKREWDRLAVCMAYFLAERKSAQVSPRSSVACRDLLFCLQLSGCELLATARSDVASARIGQVPIDPSDLWKAAVSVYQNFEADRRINWFPNAVHKQDHRACAQSDFSGKSLWYQDAPHPQQNVGMVFLFKPWIISLALPLYLAKCLNCHASQLFLWRGLFTVLGYWSVNNVEISQQVCWANSCLCLLLKLTRLLLSTKFLLSSFSPFYARYSCFFLLWNSLCWPCNKLRFHSAWCRPVLFLVIMSQVAHGLMRNFADWALNGLARIGHVSN